MLAGYMANEDVTLANITVAKQEIGVVVLGAYFGDGVSSGLLGLAYPNLTQAYSGNDPFEDDTSFGHNIVYPTLFTNMWQKLGVAPLFSLAISRDNSTASFLTLGGVPENVTLDNNTFVSTPIKMARGSIRTTRGISESKPFFAFYAIDVFGIISPPNVANSSSSNSSTLAPGNSTVPVPVNGSVPLPVNGSVPLPVNGTVPVPLNSSLPIPVNGSSPGLGKRQFIPRSSLQKRATKTGVLDRLFPRQMDDSKTPPPVGDGPSGPDKPPPGQHSITMIVDSGTTLMYLPDEIADAVNFAYDPPAECDNYGNCFVECSAKAPSISVRINTTDFHINPKDMIVDNVDRSQVVTPPGMKNPCSSGVGPAGNGMYVLGEVFLKNVLAVFDVGAGEMRFAARENY